MQVRNWIDKKPRILGMLIGAIILFPPIYFFVYPGEMMMNIFFVILLFLDWYLQKSLIYKSKLVTVIVSVLTGYGLASIVVMQIVLFFLIM